MAAYTALVIGNMIGSGIFLLPSLLAPYGGMAIGGWLFTSAGAIILALLFARLARLVPRAGGPYAYTRAGFGDFAGFWIAWGYWITIWSGNAVIAVALVSYLAAFFPSLTNPQLAGIVAIGTVWVVTWINLRGVKSAGLVQTITTVLKLIPLVAMATIGLFYIDWNNFVPINPTGKPWFMALISTATLTILVPYAFCSIAELVILFIDQHQFSGKRLGAAALLGVLGFVRRQSIREIPDDSNNNSSIATPHV